MLKKLKAYLDNRRQDKQVMKFILENPLQTMTDQDLYSMLCDLPDFYFERLQKLMELAKETRIEKEKYFAEKKQEEKLSIIS